MERSVLRSHLRAYPLGSEALDQLTSFGAHHPTAFTNVQLLPSYTYDDGTEEREVLRLHGGVTISYENQQYRLPAYIVLPHAFPKVPPLVYMNPNETMVRNSKSPYVDGSLRVISTYIDRWEYPFSSLERLYEDMKEDFGRNPPLKSGGRRDGGPGVGHSGGSGSCSPRRRQQQQKQFIDSLHELVNASLQVEYEYLSTALTEKNATGVALEKRVGELRAELGEVERSISDVTRTNDALTGWLGRAEARINACKVGNPGKFVSGGRNDDGLVHELDAYEAAAPMAGPARASLEAAACERAVQDAVRILDVALEDERVTWTAYKRMLSQLAAFKFQARVVQRREKSSGGSMGANVLNAVPSLDCDEWKYPDVVSALDGDDDVGIPGANATEESRDILGENPLQRGRFKDLVSASRLFRSMP